MLKNKLQLNTDIYSESSIRESCAAYKTYARIKIKKKNLLLYIEIANALEEMPKQIQKEFVLEDIF